MGLVATSTDGIDRNVALFLGAVSIDNNEPDADRLLAQLRFALCRDVANNIYNIGEAVDAINSQIFSTFRKDSESSETARQFAARFKAEFGNAAKTRQLSKHGAENHSSAKKSKAHSPTRDVSTGGIVLRGLSQQTHFIVGETLSNNRYFGFLGGKEISLTMAPQTCEKIKDFLADYFSFVGSLPTPD